MVPVIAAIAAASSAFHDQEAILRLESPFAIAAVPKKAGLPSPESGWNAAL